ncbi:MAG: hypothetical protein KGI79_00370 [Patescibacteria group bacterium]|nr:hypothetical protein [Patescibacteria group bacterium]MDE2116322.1 hypothetical protein [Patescibacteria group bacterium]
MNTEHPSREIYFVFAFTRCRLKVYEADEGFIRGMLAKNPRVELVASRDNETYEEVDTRVLGHLMADSIGPLFKRIVDNNETLKKALGILAADSP